MNSQRPTSIVVSSKRFFNPPFQDDTRAGSFDPALPLSVDVSVDDSGLFVFCAL